MFIFDILHTFSIHEVIVWAPMPNLIDHGGGGPKSPPPSISALVIDRDIIFSGGSCVFLEKITFLVTAVRLLLSRFLAPSL